LCDFLVDVAAGLEDACGFELRGAKVVELGSGTGVVGIACAALGASEVVLTDGGSRSLLKLAETNAAKNAAMNDDSRLIDSGKTAVRVCGYKWGDANVPQKIIESAPFDLIIGSDCTYSAGGHRALCDAVNDLWRCGRVEDAGSADPTATAPTVILAHQHRTLAGLLAGRGSAGWGQDPNLAMFIETAKTRGLEVEEVRLEKLAWHGLRNVSVLRVTRRGKETNEAKISESESSVKL
jgi:hypothetical protein